MPDGLEPYELKGSRTVLRGVGGGNVPRLLDTDIVFALFDLLGLQFSPRLRDLANQRLCRIKGRDLHYPSLKFTSYFRPEYVRSQWSELLRVAATLKSGWVTSSLLISKFQSYPRQHHLTALLQEYGKLVKTTFILRYLQSRPLRRRIHAQLNKGEQLHALRAWLWFGGDGHLRRKQPGGRCRRCPTGDRRLSERADQPGRRLEYGLHSGSIEEASGRWP